MARDRWGVPHVQAESDHDLFFAQGYVVAQDRFWQMELSRRAAAGRLSELVGARALDTDRFLRRLGFARIAAEAARELEPATLRLVQAYADGVSAYLAAHANRLPPEFYIIKLTNPGFHPEPWTAVDCLALGTYLGWTLSPNWDNEWVRARLIAEMGLEAAAEIDPAGESPRTTGVPKEIDFRRVDWDFGFGIADPGVVPVSGQSNNWAVAGSRTTSGAPLIANDPHLRPSQPGTWYEIHLRGGGYDVAGVTIPGLPGVIIGHNQRIAWGVTVGMVDTQDLVIQRFDPTDRYRYDTPDGPREVERRIESIRVAGRRSPVEEVVRITEAGPILNPNRGTGGPTDQIALRSASLAPGQVARSIFALNRAGDWAEFRAALSDWAGPCLNFVYADVAGNIGYQLAGQVPLRSPGDTALLPVPGWSADYAWAGWIPFDDLPRESNPDRGYCATANHQIAGDDYPHRLSHEWTDSFRQDRIAARLSENRKVDRDLCRQLQLDCFSQSGIELIQALAGIPIQDAAAAETLAVLREWDGRLDRDSTLGAVYAVFRQRLIGRLLADHVPARLRDHYLGRGLHPVLDPVSSFQVRFGSLIRKRIDAARAAGWPDDARSAVESALRETLTELTDRLGSDRAEWRWGRLHRVTYPHALGKLPVVGRVFNVGPLPIDGDGETVLQSNIDLWTPYDAKGWSPSYRLIVDVGNFDRTLAVLPTGQSGHPLSRHYRDQSALFQAGGYHPLPYSAGAVRRATVSTLLLTPT